MFREYRKRHKGPALILGSAPCLAADLKAAEKILPVAAVFCVNEATTIRKPDFLVSLHYEKMHEFDRRARAHWPDGTWSRHAAVVTERGCSPDKIPAVDYWWPTMWRPAATSAWFAAEIAEAMGFSKILFCGAPMNGGDGYYHTETDDAERFGVIKPAGAYVKSVHETIRMLKAEELVPSLRSMSGFTRDVFGAPDWS